MVILGAGESGVGAALLASRKGYDVFLSDSGMIAEKYLHELDAWGIAYEQGQHTEHRILEADEVVKSPGIPEKALMVKKIRAAGINIISEIELAYRYAGDSKIIAITDTPISPIGQIADFVLLAKRKSATYFNSFTSAVTLVNCLVAGVSVKSKRSLKMLKAFDQVDNEWSYFMR